MLLKGKVFILGSGGVVSSIVLALKNEAIPNYIEIEPNQKLKN